MSYVIVFAVGAAIGALCLAFLNKKAGEAAKEIAGEVETEFDKHWKP